MRELFATIMGMSITASIVILAVMLIRLPLKKTPKWISYALWAVVAFRLVCPFTIESRVSAIPALCSPSQQSNASSQEVLSPLVRAALKYGLRTC
jgi:beta-lactamase regulating signal transducer with metallopeptidase domain